MKNLAIRGRKSYGFTLILTSLMMSFIVAVVGVLVDAALLAAARDRLNEVVEGSAMAAGQAVVGVTTVAAAEAQARAAALGVTKARFRDGLLGLDPERIELNVSCRPEPQPNGRPSGLVDISVRTELPAPVYFMRLWGVAGVPVSDESHFSRRNRVTLLALADQPAATPELQRQVAAMASTLSPYDTIRILPGAGGLAAALAAGYREVQTIDQPAATNGIVVISTDAQRLTDPAAERVLAQIRSDSRYRIRVGTIQWNAGLPLASQLARIRDFSPPPRLTQAHAHPGNLPRSQ